jgi:hypothetical protein
MTDAYEAYTADKGSPVTFGELIRRFYARFSVYQISDDLRRYTFEYDAEKVLKGSKWLEPKATWNIPGESGDFRKVAGGEI